MSAKKKNGAAETDQLKKKNALLRKQLKELKAERDAYLHAIHTWAKKRVSEEEVERWLQEEKVEGSLSEFIREVKQGK